MVEVVGAVSIWAAPHWKTDPALGLLTFGIILLQPGGLAAVMLVEKLLCMSPVTIPQMTWVELVLAVAFNAGLWWTGVNDPRRKTVECRHCSHRYEQPIAEMTLRTKSETEINALGGPSAFEYV